MQNLSYIHFRETVRQSGKENKFMYHFIRKKKFKRAIIINLINLLIDVDLFLNLFFKTFKISKLKENYHVNKELRVFH